MQVVELALPALFMLLLGVIKGNPTPEVFAEVVPSSDTPVMTYDALQNTTTFPNVLCDDDNIFLRYVLCVSAVLQ